MLTIPLAIGLQIAGMLLTGWGIAGIGWLAAGILCLPTLLACCWYFLEYGVAKQAFVKGSALGVAATIILALIGGTLIIAAGSMDGGI